MSSAQSSHVIIFGIPVLKSGVSNSKQFSLLIKASSGSDPGGNLSVKLKTAEDLMVKGKNIPLVNSNTIMKDALKIITRKKLGVIIVKEKSNTVGILTDGDIKRLTQKNKNLLDIKVKYLMTKKPISIDKDMLAAEALSIMNSKKITSLCVHNNKNKKKTIGLLHIHQILNANIQ